MGDDEHKPGPVPKEALRYWKAKGLTPAFSYLDVWKEEHAAGFTIAKILERDLLEDLREITGQALAQGKTFAQWKKEAIPKLGNSKLWLPHANMVGGVPKRLWTIYSTNMRVARAVGQWERIERTKEARPYLEYLLGPSDRHREHHAAWAGTILPVDDPFWDTHMTPNGWG